MEKLTFDRLGLSPEVLKAVAALGFEEASPIQGAAIPVLLAGQDVVGKSQTGSGKTGIRHPAIEKTVAAEHAVQVLVLCPTRELATQVAEQTHKLAAFKRGIHALPVYGGASFERQAHELKRGAQMVIGTPGRIMDHMDRGTLKLDRVKFVVLDEADRMLDMGFRDDIRKILDAVPAERQTAFFSATVSSAIRGLINRYARDPVTLDIEQKEVSAPAIEQWFTRCIRALPTHCCASSISTPSARGSSSATRSGWSMNWRMICRRRGCPRTACTAASRRRSARGS